MKGDEFFGTMATRPPFASLHPAVAAFFKGYLSHEKVVAFRDRWVVNTNFPPFPSRAFDNMAGQFRLLGDGAYSRLYSVTMAVTNRCSFNCWHCYNAGRRQQDVPLARLRRLAGELQDLGTVVLTLTGGEPLLRDDLDEIVSAFDDRSMIIIGTTGDGLTLARARRLRESGAFGVGISLDSTVAAEHDRMRGRPGAFQIAVDALGAARSEGLYPYVVAVATREFLERDRFMPFMRFAGECGAAEVHLLEPSAQGRLEGHQDVLLTGRERQLILGYQDEVACDETLPILSSFTYVEGADAFGCGAGLTHVYIDGSGEVCPCNLVPLSFGNLLRDDLESILRRMRLHFREPRTTCVGKMLSSRLPVGGPRPLPPNDSCRLCETALPTAHELPRFFRVRSEASGAVGATELQLAYNAVHEDYDAFWLSQAASPIDALVETVDWTAPRTEETAPRTAHRAPRTEPGAPRTEETAPRTAHRAPRTEPGAPRTEETAPRTAEIASARGTCSVAPGPLKSTPRRELRTCLTPSLLQAPRTEESAPRTAHCAPRTEESAPRTAHCAPRTEETAPRTGETAPRTIRVFEAGCGTGYGTARWAQKATTVVAADLSEGMLSEARARLARDGRQNVRFVCGDALAILRDDGPFDLIVSTWVLGYIPLEPFFKTAARALAPGGQLAFVVHREHSPREPLDVFAEIVAQDPSVLLKQVAFDFPHDGAQVRRMLGEAGFTVTHLVEGRIAFPCNDANAVLEHLLKSGAGTAFYDAIDKCRRDQLTAEFLRQLEERRGGRTRFDVVHEYVACVARLT